MERFHWPYHQKTVKFLRAGLSLLPMEKLKPQTTHKPVQNYYEALPNSGTRAILTKARSALLFQTLLSNAARQFGWKLVPEWPIQARSAPHLLRLTARSRMSSRLTNGFWEPKTVTTIFRKINKNSSTGLRKQYRSSRLRRAIRFIAGQFFM